MNEDLTGFLDNAKSLCEESIAWGSMPLRLAYYLGDELPPLQYVSSVRAIVFRDCSVLVVREENGHMYILPGGRVEEGESPEQTLRREVLEETGWTLSGIEPLGFMRFHHLGARPAGYRYPYPDFIWPVFLAEAADYFSDEKVPDDYVFDSEFRPIQDVKDLPIDKGELMLLEAALRRKG